MLKAIVRTVLRLLYRVEVKGLNNYSGFERVLIVANHQSFLNTHIARRAWVRPFLRFARVFPLDPRQSGALKEIVRHLRAGHPTVIFPEGRITVTGTLMKIYDGTGMVADRAGAKVLPVRIDGAQFTPFSRLKGKVRRRLFPKITLYVLPLRDICPQGDGRSVHEWPDPDADYLAQVCGSGRIASCCEHAHRAWHSSPLLGRLAGNQLGVKA